MELLCCELCDIRKHVLPFDYLLDILSNGSINSRWSINLYVSLLTSNSHYWHSFLSKLRWNGHCRKHHHFSTCITVRHSFILIML